MATNLSEVFSDILIDRRQYFIEKVKAPLMKALIILANRYPEPTKENTKKQISHVLLDIWDEFFTHENNPSRHALFNAIRRVTICELEHDTYYSQRMTWFLKRLTEKYMSGEWRPLEPCCPSTCWTDEATREAAEAERQAFKKRLILGDISPGVET